MWGAILGRYIRQNQPTAPSWRLPCFNVERFATGVHWYGNPVISKETSILCCCSWRTLWTLSLNTEKAADIHYWSVWSVDQKSCAKFDSLLSKSYWIFMTRLHVHMKKWTLKSLKFKLLYLLNHICYLIKFASVNSANLVNISATISEI